MLGRGRKINPRIFQPSPFPRIWMQFLLSLSADSYSLAALQHDISLEAELCSHAGQQSPRTSPRAPRRNWDEQRLNSAGAGADSSVCLTKYVTRRVFFSCHIINFLLVPNLRVLPCRSQQERHTEEKTPEKWRVRDICSICSCCPPIPPSFSLLSWIQC